MYFVVVAIVYLSIIDNHVLSRSARLVESPHYTVVYNESDFEVRLYREISWMSALVRGTTSFENSTKDGFHRYLLPNIKIELITIVSKFII